MSLITQKLDSSNYLLCKGKLLYLSIKMYKYIAYGLRMTSMDENDFHGEPFMKRGKEHYHKINWKELGYFDAYASKITR